jgi:hypothetical protein
VISNAKYSPMTTFLPARREQREREGERGGCQRVCRNRCPAALRRALLR